MHIERAYNANNIIQGMRETKCNILKIILHEE